LSRLLQLLQRSADLSVGPYRTRSSRWVGFVDPLRLDVNYVPHTFFPNHNLQLSSLRLGEGGDLRPLSPFVVHWAGLGTNKWRLAEEYSRRFNATRQCPPAAAPSPRLSLGSPQMVDPVRRKKHCINARDSWIQKWIMQGRQGELYDTHFWIWWHQYGCKYLGVEI